VAFINSLQSAAMRFTAHAYFWTSSNALRAFWSAVIVGGQPA
jgi:hypothetical protein